MLLLLGQELRIHQCFFFFLIAEMHCLTLLVLGVDHTIGGDLHLVILDHHTMHVVILVVQIIILLLPGKGETQGCYFVSPYDIVLM